MKYILSFFLSLFSLVSISQELNCQVQIDASQVMNVDKRIFETLQTAMTEFINNTRWTNDVFRNEERIECSMVLVLKSGANGEFVGTLQVQSRRPVYRSGYNSVLLNYNDDDIYFKYLEYQPLEFNQTQHLSNLTSILAFYAYIIIGLDYDSFALEGGTFSFNRAQTIVNNAQGGSEIEKGWRAHEDNRNRYWLVDNLTKPGLQAVREAIYKYHRIGLDNMSVDPGTGRNTIFQSLELLKKAQSNVPGAFIFQVFFSTKNSELINIFSGGLPDEKNKVVTLLSQLDPVNTSKYQKIIKS